MGTVEEISARLASEMVASMNDAVAGGEFNSRDQLVTAPLRDWVARRDSDLAHLRALLEEGVASGFEPHDGVGDIKREGRKRLGPAA